MVATTVNVSTSLTEVCHPILTSINNFHELTFPLTLDSVTEPEILAILGPMIKRYALERLDGEHFGDFVIRAGYIAPTLTGATWWDRSGGEGIHAQSAVA